MANLRLIPELAGIPVLAYDEQYPIQNDLGLAVWKMRAPGLLVIWRGTSPGAKGRMEAWRHSFGIVVRATSDVNTVPQAYDVFYFWRAVVNGVPAGQNCDFRHIALHESVYQMQPPSILRQTLFVTQESRLDYHEITLAYDEKGDY